MEKDITKYLDNEDLEILRNIIFERYTYSSGSYLTAPRTP